MKLACNFAIIRFLPYSETGEFVNVGLFLISHQTGFFDFILVSESQRVADFFPELDMKVFRDGLKFFGEELSLYKSRLNKLPTAETPQQTLQTFKNLVRPRESLFRFGGIKTILTDAPKATLKELYYYHVDRQFARETA